MKQSRFSEEQIFGFLRPTEVGMGIAELCLSGGFSQIMFYKRHVKYGDMQASKVQRL